MGSQMDVLYLKSANNTFNHVLAIFTRTSAPGKLETDASVFVGDGLILREVQDQELLVPASEIGLIGVPFDPADVVAPRTLYAAAAAGQTNLSLLTSFTNTALTVTFASPSTLTVKVAGPTPAMILIEGSTVGKPQPIFANLTATSQNVSLTGLVAGNTYYAVVFVPSYPVAFHKFTA